jgi:hypothetical protein
MLLILPHKCLHQSALSYRRHRFSTGVRRGGNAPTLTIEQFNGYKQLVANNAIFELTTPGLSPCLIKAFAKMKAEPCTEMPRAKSR